MKTPIFIALLAVFVSACASRRDRVPQSEIDRRQQEEFTFRESQASRLQ